MRIFLVINPQSPFTHHLKRVIILN